MKFEEKRELLLERIETRSDNNQMDWKVDADEDSFSAALGPQYVVRVTWPRGTAYLFVLDQEGTELFKFTEGPDDPNLGVMKIWRSAKRIALGLDDVLDKILKDLE